MKPITRTATIELNAPPDEIFPLFSPLGEHQWVADWNPEYVYPPSGEATPDTVFKTTHGETDTIWVMGHYDEPRHALTFVNVTPESHVTRLEIECNPAEVGKSTAQVTYTYTALTEHGQQAIERHSEAQYRKVMDWWAKSINHSLLHGEPLAHA